MFRRASILAVIGSVCAGAITSAALAGGEAGELALRDVGWKFVGYTTEPAEQGTVNVLNAMFVHYMLPAEREHQYPVVFVHGGGGQGTDWLETPDGRDGWVDYFVADGWDVYVVDRPGHGRSQSNQSCGNGSVGVGNSGITNRLATSDGSVWPGGAPTPTNDAVVFWTASAATAPYCGNEVAADTISALLDEIGPAIIIAHSAGGGSTFMVPDRNAANVVGIIAFEAAGGQPVAPGFGGSPPAIAGWEVAPPLPADFEPVDHDGCLMQGDQPSRLVNYDGIPVVLVASEMGLSIFGEANAGRKGIECQAAAWRQAGVDASSVFFPDRGLSGGGHFAMAQLDNGAYAREFIRLATQIEVGSDK